MPRFDHIPGIGRVRVYDNRGKTADRFLVLFEDHPTTDRNNQPLERPVPYGMRFGLGLSENPSHPQGVSMAADYLIPQTYGTGADHRRIPFESLPERVQQHVINRMKEDA